MPSVRAAGVQHEEATWSSSWHGPGPRPTSGPLAPTLHCPHLSPSSPWRLGPAPGQTRLQVAARLLSRLTWVFVFLELVLSVSSVSEATFSRWRLVLLRGDEASSFTFCRGSSGEDDSCGSLGPSL